MDALGLDEQLECTFTTNTLPKMLKLIFLTLVHMWSTDHNSNLIGAVYFKV